MRTPSIPSRGELTPLGSVTCLGLLLSPGVLLGLGQVPWRVLGLGLTPGLRLGACLGLALGVLRRLGCPEGLADRAVLSLSVRDSQASVFLGLHLL